MPFLLCSLKIILVLLENFVQGAQPSIFPLDNRIMERTCSFLVIVICFSGTDTLFCLVLLWHYFFWQPSAFLMYLTASH